MMEGCLRIGQPPVCFPPRHLPLGYGGPGGAADGVIDHRDDVEVQHLVSLMGPTRIREPTQQLLEENPQCRRVEKEETKNKAPLMENGDHEVGGGDGCHYHP